MAVRENSTIIQKSNKQEKLMLSLNLMQYEGELVWSKFNALVLAQSILLALIGSIYNKSNSLTLLRSINVFGILICILWLIATIRSFDTLDLWTNIARETADRLKIDLLSLGDHHKNYHEIEFNVKTINGKNEKKYSQRRFITKIFKINNEIIAYLIIVIFILLHAVSLISLGKIIK